MALSEIQLAKIKVDYQVGKLSRLKIAQKYGISRNTLSKHAKAKKWKYAISEQELSKIVENRTYEKLITDSVDRATEITNNFLGDIEKYRKLAIIPASELASAYNDAEERSEKENKRIRVPKDEFSRIWESTKAIKAAIETLKIGYEGARKALGMDRDDDVEKARKIKGAERESISDPTEGMTREEVQARIKEIKNK